MADSGRYGACVFCGRTGPRAGFKQGENGLMCRNAIACIRRHFKQKAARHA